MFLDANKVRYESVLRTVITRTQKHVANVYIADYATFGILCTSMFSGGINQQYEIYDTDTNDLMSDKDDMLYEFNMIRCDMPSVMCIKMCQL